MEMMQDNGGSIVSMFRRASPMSFPAISQVDAYWEGLRDGRLMPDRAEIDPRGLESALEFTFILEHIAPGVGRIRVAGMHLSDLLGMEVRGMPLTALFAPAARDRLSRTLEAVVNEPQVADLTLTSDRGIGRPSLNARLYLAPLGNLGNSVPRVLGCLQAVGKIGHGPRRFGIEQVQMRRIVATTAASRLPDAAPATLSTIPAFAKISRSLSQELPQAVTPQTPARRPELRLVTAD